MPKHYPHRDYRGEPLSRRELLRRGAALGTAAAAAGYLAFAPEHYPLSLRDDSGLRGLPQPRPFRLPDFRVAKPAALAAVDVGVGRQTELIDRPTGHAPAPGAVAAALRKALDAIGGLRHYVAPGEVVLVKPNVAFDRSPILGATTSPDILETLVRMLLVDCRAAEVRVADNPIESPADCFAKSGIRLAAERAGGRVFLPDGNAFELLHTPGATLIERWPFFRRPFHGVDRVIGIAPVKDHNLCHASLGIKNWYGLLGGRRNQFHQDIHEIVAELSQMIRPTLTILDGTRVLMANGPTGGDPANVRNAGTVLAAVDPVAMDAWAFEHLLRRSPDALPAYLARAEARGSGRVDYRGRVREIA